MSKKLNLDVFDADDQWLINSLYSKNKSISHIARKLRHDEELIEAFISSTNESTSPSESNSTTNDISTKSEPKKTEIEEPTPEKPEEVDFYVREAKFGKAKCVPIDVMEKQQKAVCQIQFANDNDPASGFLVEILDMIGIITSNHVLSKNTDCNEAQAIFEDADGENKVTVKFDHETLFWTNPKIDITFVGCEEKALEELKELEIIPWKSFGKVKNDSSISVYYTTIAKGEKVCIQKKLSMCKKKTIGYDGAVGVAAIGAPVYCQDKLVGMHHGSHRTMGDEDSVQTKNEAIRIDQIVNWLKTFYCPGQDVQVQWNDNHWYNSKIIRKTKLGYLVEYHGFNERQDRPLDKIKKLPYLEDRTVVIEEVSQEYDSDIMTVEQWLSGSLKLHKKYWSEFQKHGYTDMAKIRSFGESQIEKMLIDIGAKHGTAVKIRASLSELNKTSSSTTSTTTTTTTMSEEEFDEMDRELIDGMVRRKLTVEQISRKIHKSQTVIKEYIDSKLPGLLAVNNTPMDRDWQPSDGDIDLSHVFEQDGKCSIRFASNHIQENKGRTSIGTEILPKLFYLKSTSHQMYFKISLTFDI